MKTVLPWLLQLQVVLKFVYKQSPTAKTYIMLQSEGSSSYIQNTLLYTNATEATQYTYMIQHTVPTAWADFQFVGGKPQQERGHDSGRHDLGGPSAKVLHKHHEQMPAQLMRQYC